MSHTLTRDSDFCLALISSCFVNAIQRPSFIISSVESKIFIPEIQELNKSQIRSPNERVLFEMQPKRQFVAYALTICLFRLNSKWNH